jgi:hypothetical protein
LDIQPEAQETQKLHRFGRTCHASIRYELHMKAKNNEIDHT